jgi:DNA polymerase-3 subunit delta
MKLAVRDIESFLASPPPACRLFLFYGPDAGLIQLRARAMLARFAPDLNDPFSVSILDGDDAAKDPALLLGESAMLSLGSDQRVLWLRNADDKCSKAVENLLLADTIQAIVIIEAGELGPKSVMRKLSEAAMNAAAIPCYVEDARQVAQYVTRTLSAAGFRITRDAAAWFGDNLAGDRGMITQELEKIITYMGNSSMQSNDVDLRVLQNIAAGGAALEEDAFIDAIGTQAAVPMVHKLIAEGQPVTNIIRTLGRHANRLYTVQLHIQHGDDVSTAMDKLQPKVFFKREAAFRAQLARFSLRTLSRLRARLLELERDCKQTGAPDDTLIGQLILMLGGTAKRNQRA